MLTPFPGVALALFGLLFVAGIFCAWISDKIITLMGAILGICPESGPHLIFVMMYDQGLIPFSVLFTTSFVQDGHGMLPLLSYSIKDSLIERKGDATNAKRTKKMGMRPLWVRVLG
jgi:hypothetical protein